MVGESAMQVMVEVSRKRGSSDRIRPRSNQWQFDQYPQPRPGILRPNLAVMQPDCPHCNRQSQPNPSGRTVAGIVNAYEWLKDFAQSFIRHSWAVIPHGEPRHVLCPIKFHFHRGVRRRKVNRVSDHVFNCSPQKLPVAAHL